jgi:hypothetical protein
MKYNALFTMVLILISQQLLIAQSSGLVASGKSHRINEKTINWTVGLLHISLRKITAPSALDQLETKLTDGRFEVFPNPTSGLIHVNPIEQSVKSYGVLFDLQGRQIFSGIIEQPLILDLVECAAGVYILRIGNKTFKIIKT